MRLPDSVKWVATSAHPAFALRGLPQAGPHIVEAIARAKRFATGAETRPTFDILLRPTPPRLREYLATREPGAPCFIDIETPRDMQEQIDIVGMSVSRGTAAVVPYLPEYADIIAEILASEEIVKGGHNFAYDVHAFRANGFEVAWPVIDTIQAEALIYPPRAQRKTTEKGNRKKTRGIKWLSLAASVLRRFPGPYWKDPRSEYTRAYFRLAFPDVPSAFYPLLYCGLDVTWNWMLWERQRAELEALGMLRLFREIVAPAGYAAALMEDDGIPVDEARREKRKGIAQGRIDSINRQVEEFTSQYHTERVIRLQEAAEKAALALSTLWGGAPACGKHPDYFGATNRSKSKCDQCRWVYGETATYREDAKAIKKGGREVAHHLKQIGPAFAPTNDNHWRSLLFSAPPLGLGLVPTRMTKGGIEGVGKDDLTDLQRIYPEVPVLSMLQELKHRHHQMKFIYDTPVDARGRAHALFPLHKTENGRFSSGTDATDEDKERESEAGNLQNVTESDRQIFCAPPGFKWVEIDGSQFELRAMAWEARAIDLLASLARGEDVHSENAAAIFGCKTEDARKTMVWFEGMLQDARRAGKRPTHGWDYGLGDEKCGKMFKPMAKAALEEVREFLAKYADMTAGQEGVSTASWDRRLRAVERSANPDTERRKFVMRMYEMANTLRAREWRLAYFARRPELARFQREVIDRVTSGDHVLTNSFGRRLKFWGFKWDYQAKQMRFMEREEALAFIPASDVGDMAKALMLPLSRIARTFGGWLAHMGHDSFSAIVPDACVQEYIRMAKLQAEREWPEMGRIEPFGHFRCPFEAKVGQNWGPRHLHDATCAPMCERENPDGLVGYRLDSAAA